MPDPPLGRGESAERVRERVRWWARPGLAYRAAIVRGRWAIVAFWIAAAVLTPLLAPAGGGAGGDLAIWCRATAGPGRRRSGVSSSSRCRCCPGRLWSYTNPVA